MRYSSKILFSLIFALIPCLSTASETAVTLNGETIRQSFQGQTVSGRYTGGGLFTEYHHEDGRALGHNGFEPNRDACWIVVGDAICYYYGPLEKRTTHCFTVVLNNRLYVLKVRGSNRINALATIEPGNARGHHDGGKPWVCDGLVSRAPAPPMSKRLVAIR